MFGGSRYLISYKNGAMYAVNTMSGDVEMIDVPEAMSDLKRVYVGLYLMYRNRKI
jgi:hypothetical protein